MGNLGSLQQLLLFNNKLTGPFPVSFTTGLKDLTYLTLRANPLNCTLPEWYLPQSMQYLDLSDTRLRGKPPKLSWDRRSTPKIHYIDLSGTALNVTLDRLGKLSLCLHVKLRRMLLPIASEFRPNFNCSVFKFNFNWRETNNRLVELDLSQNDITTDLRSMLACISALFPRISILNMSDNAIPTGEKIECGTEPSESYVSLLDLDLKKNKLEDLEAVLRLMSSSFYADPECFYSVFGSRLRSLDVRQNDLKLQTSTRSVFKDIPQSDKLLHNETRLLCPAYADNLDASSSFQLRADPRVMDFAGCECNETEYFNRVNKVCQKCPLHTDCEESANAEGDALRAHQGWYPVDTTNGTLCDNLDHCPEIVLLLCIKKSTCEPNKTFDFECLAGHDKHSLLCSR
jgi:hypothetical protein